MTENFYIELVMNLDSKIMQFLNFEAILSAIDEMKSSNNS